MSEKLWEVLNSEPILEHRLVSVAMEQVRLPDNRIIADLPRIHTGEYIQVFVVNDNYQAMIIEGYKHGLGRSTWQLVGGALAEDENPLAAAERSLLVKTGYQCSQWRHLGSYVVDANRYVGVGHFFLACNAQMVDTIHDGHLNEETIRWVSLTELKHALWDGRVACISYATNISLGLLALGNSFV